MKPTLPQHATEQDRYVRQRTLFTQRQDYEWCHAPGQPPFTLDVPRFEEWTREKKSLWNIDIDESLADLALGFWRRFRHANNTIDSYARYFPLRHLPDVASRWMKDSEFARQRLDGINPFLITLATAIPENFPVTDADVRGLIPDEESLASLLAKRRLFLVDYKAIHGIELVYGRFQVAPIGLFWTNGRGELRPLAIQLGQDPGEAGGVIFTPNDDRWTWLTARAHFSCADGTYHELAAHLLRTHLVMETFWTAANRSLAAQHPIWQLLQPHFTGTIEINHMARTELIAPGGPIDQSIAVGAEGGLNLVAREFARYRFDDWDPRTDFARRGVADPDVLPNYHYRDDALRYWELIASFVHDLLRPYYPSDEVVRADTELQAFYREITTREGGGIQGLPAEGFARFEDVHQVLTQVVYTASVEHSAVNNGQFDQFGWIPNTPGAMWLPPPTDKSPRSEANFVYALPPGIPSAEQIMLVHLLSEKTLTPLGHYDDNFFWADAAARLTVDRFRGGIADLGRAIVNRNRTLDVPYRYLVPQYVARSIAV